MTHNGYSFKRPTLASNYIQLLTTIQTLNDCGYYPNRKQLRRAVAYDVKDVCNLGRGFRKIVQKLADSKYIYENKTGNLWITVKGDDLINTAIDRTITSIKKRN